jgi:fatty acid desaturase
MRIAAHERKSLRLVGETAGIFLLLAGAALAALRELPGPLALPIIAALGVAQGLWLDRMYTTAHEAVHKKLFPAHPRLNDLVGTLLMAPIAAPFTIYRKIHGFHHGANRRDAGSAALDHFPVRAAASAIARFRYRAAWIFYVFGGGFFLHSLATILIFLAVPSRDAVRISPVFRAWPPRLRRRAWMELGLGLAFHAAVYAGLGGSAWIAVLGLPLLVFAWVWSMLLYVYHYRTTVGRDVRHNVRSLPPQPFFSWLLLNFNEHATHHRDPSIPWYALPERRYELPESHKANDDVATLAQAVWRQREGPILWVRE